MWFRMAIGYQHRNIRESITALIHFQITPSQSVSCIPQLAHPQRTGLRALLIVPNDTTRPTRVVSRPVCTQKWTVTLWLRRLIRSKVRSQGESPGQHTLVSIECLDQTLQHDLTLKHICMRQIFGIAATIVCK